MESPLLPLQNCTRFRSPATPLRLPADRPMEPAAMASPISQASLPSVPLVRGRFSIRPLRGLALASPAAARRLVTRCTVGDKAEAEKPIEKSQCLYFRYSLSFKLVFMALVLLIGICLDHNTEFTDACATGVVICSVPGFPPFPTVMDINQIRDILPHR